MVDVVEGFLFHPDPDILVAYQHGQHGYRSIEQAQRAYVRGDIMRIELEAILEDLLINGSISDDESP